MKIQSAAKINNVPVIVIDGQTYNVATLKTVIAAAESAPTGTTYSIEVDAVPAQDAQAPAKA